MQSELSLLALAMMVIKLSGDVMSCDASGRTDAARFADTNAYVEDTDADASEADAN